MSDPRIDLIRRLARRSSLPALQRTLEKSRSEDIAEAIKHLTPDLRLVVWENVIDDPEKLSEILSNLDGNELTGLIQRLNSNHIVHLLHLMEVDDQADLLQALPETLRNNLLEQIQESERTQVEDLLAYPEDSAGGLMHIDVFRMPENATCREAITKLQELENVEMVFYIYVENAFSQLVGVLSMRSLLTHSPSKPLSEIMSTDLIVADPAQSQEDVATMVSRYDLLAIPVVDSDRSLLGIITVDDIVDVIQDMHAKDVLLMAGLSEESNQNRSVLNAFKQRFTWLLVTLFGGIGMAELINAFESTLEAQAVLAGFIPVMLGTGGNVGIQAATIAVRNIATGHIDFEGMTPLIWRECRVGILLGLSFALVLGGYCLLREQDILLGLAVGSSIIITVITAAILGLLVPIFMDRIGFDPAVATGPFVTTGIDLVAILIYFSTCQLIMNI
ncbi:MAG: magnesium transporter [Myxococcota bacterium]|nr:magnesium transporter [Myxococcota bacterium]MEC8380900.1 magnesium transporter [Myxococcota bacterium]